MVNLEALLNDYDFTEFAKVQLMDDSGDSSVYTNNDLLNLNGKTYKLSISNAGDTLTLSYYGEKKHYSTQIGNYLPEFNGINILGKDLSSNDLRGTYALVYFWNSSCSASALVLNQYVKKILLEEDDLKLLSVAFDEISNINEETKSFDPKYLIVEPANGEINKIFDVNVYPSYYLINPDGKVLLRSGIGVRLTTFEDEIKRAIKLDREQT